MPAKSIFSSLQSWFVADNHGRYLALILAEISRHRPNLMVGLVRRHCDLGDRMPSKFTISNEYSFAGKRSQRRADLALFEAGAKTPCILIEIKYKDRLLHEGKSKESQADDYRHWKRAGKGARDVLLISRESLIEPDLSVARWTDVAHFLKNSRHPSDLVKSLVLYLEEEGLVMNNVDGGALLGFWRRTLFGWAATGAIGTNLAGPNAFGQMLNNMRLLSGRFEPMVKEAWHAAGVSVDGNDANTRRKIATIDFSVHYETNPALKRLVEKDGFKLQKGAIKAGTLYVFARHAIGNGKTWIRLEYGFDIQLSPKSTILKPPPTFIYASVEGDALKVEPPYEYKKIAFSKVTKNAERSSDELEHRFRALISSVLSETIEKAKYKLKPQQSKAMRKLSKSIQNLNL